jgi:hypothetical protein
MLGTQTSVNIMTSESARAVHSTQLFSRANPWGDRVLGRWELLTDTAGMKKMPMKAMVRASWADRME